MLEKHRLTVSSSFDFEAGGRFDGLSIVYHTSPRPFSPNEKVVWVCHALTGDSNPTDWWPQLVGEGKLLDPEEYYIVCVSMLCSAYGECGPASVNPLTGKPYLLDFPQTTVRDIVRTNIIVRQHLGIERINYLIGPSIGGFQALEWLIMEPDIFDKAVIMATAERATPYLTAYNESQRMALMADPSFAAAESVKGGTEGLKCARSIALISYRTYAGYNATQLEPDDDTVFARRASSYQRYQGEKLVSRYFDAYSYWYLTNVLDSQNVGRGRGGVRRALASIKARCTVICISSDSLFPPESMKQIAEMIPDSEYCEIHSIYGHDGFLIENVQLLPILRGVFSPSLRSKQDGCSVSKGE